MNLIIHPNQSLLDAVITHYGSLEAAMVFCISNNIPISQLPIPGTQLAITPTNSTYETERNRAYLREKEIVIGTADVSTCALVSDLVVVSVTSHTATLTFTAGENALELQWSIVEGVDISTITDIHTLAPGETSITIDGLVADTNYTFFIRSRCETDFSSWSYIVFATPYSLAMNIILYPGLLTVNMSPGPLPASTYPLSILTHEIINVNDHILSPYIATLLYNVKSDWDMGIGGTVFLGASLMTSNALQFDLPGPLTTPEVYMWISGSLGSGSTFQLVDSEGYTAETMPFLLYSPATGTNVMQSVLSIGEGTSLGMVYHMPVTIVSTGENPYFHVGEYRIKRYYGGLWVDIIGPLVAGAEYMLHLPVGVHKIGLFTTYQSSTLSAPPGPVAITSMVVEVSM